MQFSQKWEKNKLVSHSCIAEKKNLKLALEIPHLFALSVIDWKWIEKKRYLKDV